MSGKAVNDHPTAGIAHRKTPTTTMPLQYAITKERGQSEAERNRTYTTIWLGLLNRAKTILVHRMQMDDRIWKSQTKSIIPPILYRDQPIGIWNRGESYAQVGIMAA